MKYRNFGKKSQMRLQNSGNGTFVRDDTDADLLKISFAKTSRENHETP